MPNGDIYKWVRTAGLVMLIPIIMAAGPFSGYLLAELLINKMHLPQYTAIILVIAGSVASIQEVVRIIRAAIKSGGED